MKNETVKLWIGLGTCLVLGAAPAVAAPEAFPGTLARTDTAMPLLLAAGGEQGGEAGSHRAGGEGGEAGRSAGGGEAAYLTGLLEMKGHLTVALELLARGEADMAEAHFGHPEAEVLDEIAGELWRRKAPIGPDQFAALRAAVEAGEPERMRARAQDVMTAIDEAVRAGGGTQADKQLDAARGLFNAAAHEYDEALRDGRIELADEYQDGRGFVLVAEALLAGSDALRAKNAAAHAALMEQIATLKALWPSPLPPDRPAGHGEVLAAVSRVELAMSPLR